MEPSRALNLRDSRAKVWATGAFTKKFMLLRIPKKIIPIILLSLTALLIYSDTLSAPFRFDDYFSIVANPAIRDVSDLSGIWGFWPTRFLNYYSLSLNYYFGKLNVVGYHWFNLVVHIISGILVWWLALMIFSAIGLKHGNTNKRVKILALFSGLLFIAHPVQTEAVTYIIQRATSMSALFYLAALAFYSKARILQRDNCTNIASKFFYLGSLIASVMAMFTKESAVTLPFTILLYEACFLRKEKPIDWKPVIPFLAALFIVPLTMTLTHSVDFLGMHRSIEPAVNISPLQYLFTQFRVLNTYLRLVFIPFNQNLDYDYPVAGSFAQPGILLSFLSLAVIFISAVLLFRRYRIISFSIFWFFLTLLPESSVIPIKDVIFEHRLYLPMFGYCLFLASVFFYFLGKRNTRSILIILFVITAFYAVLAYKRNLVWQNEVALWDDAILKSPRKARPYNERGFVYLLKGDYEKAVIDFTSVLQIDPKYVSAYNNRGIAYTKKGSYKEAISDFSRAIAIEPGYSSAYANRAVVYFYLREYEKSRLDANKAGILGAVLDPRFLDDLGKAGVKRE